MKVLIVSQYFWPENFRINDLAVELVERGHQVTVLTGIPNYPSGKLFSGYGYFRKLRENYKGVRVIRVPLVPRGSGRGSRLALNYASFAFFATLLAPFFCKGKYDLIFVCQLSPATVGLPALLLKKIKKIPIIFWILDLWPESLSATGAIHSPRVLDWVKNMMRFIYARCDRILVSSRGFRQSIETTGGYKGDIGYFPNWVEPEYAVPMSEIVPPELPALEDGFRIMFAGNIGAAQDFETILTAAEKLKIHSNIHWFVLGDGLKFKWVKEQVQQRGLSDTVHLLGRHSSDTMPFFFEQADVMLVTLKHDAAFALTVPGKIQSYMASGRPIVAALDGEGGSLIEVSGAGIASSAGSPDGLAEAVLKLYLLPKKEREAMGKRGLEYCEENFTRDKLIDQLEEWMRSVL